MLPKISRIAIFASGAGSNAGNLMEYFANGPIKIALVVCNNPQALVLNVAQQYAVPVLMVERVSFYSEESCLSQLRNFDIDWVVLAGFLWKIPPVLVRAFRGKMINIHPALLPKYGGKGMFGHHVHEAVITANEPESGISVHFVDEIYDNGEMVEQVKCTIEPGDTAESLAVKIHKIEQTYFPAIVERVIKAKS